MNRVRVVLIVGNNGWSIISVLNGLLDWFEWLTIVLSIWVLFKVLVLTVIVVIGSIKTVWFAFEFVFDLIVLIQGSQTFVVCIVRLIITYLDRSDVHFIWIFYRDIISFTFCISKITILFLFTSFQLILLLLFTSFQLILLLLFTWI